MFFALSHIFPSDSLGERVCSKVYIAMSGFFLSLSLALMTIKVFLQTEFIPCLFPFYAYWNRGGGKGRLPKKLVPRKYV